jgi:hypothetical protein
VTTLHRLHPRAEGSHRQELGRATRPPCQVLCPSRRQAVQAGRIFRSTHEVCPQRRRQGHLGGDPQRRLRQPSVFTHVGQQGFPTSFLLAHSSGRCRRTRQKVPRVPILRQAIARAGLQASHHTANLAFCLLGARHDWASSNCARRIQQSYGGHQQVHKVDRSQAVTCPKADRVLDFLDELVHRYGLPHRIITDLGSNFNNHQ